MKSFLLLGQSNMAGRGYINEVEPILNDKIFILRNGRWVKMFVPINPDRDFSGISLAESFADEYCKETGEEVGLIPCADGGTSLDDWCVNGLLYDNAIYQARLAQRTSEIAGILWHQGENDCFEDLYPVYKEKFLRIIDGFCRDLKLENIPVLVGELGHFLAENNTEEVLKNYWHINETLLEIANTKNNIHLVSAEGLKSNPDLTHFSSTGLREFGIRYYNTYKKIKRNTEDR